MPTYAYACTSCDHRFEAVQSFSDDSLTSCPQCEGRLRKVFSAVGVVFKGSGFYRTDSRSGGSSATLPAGGGSDSGSTATKTKTETSAGSNGSSSPAASAGSKTSSSKTSSGNGAGSTSSGQGSAA